MVFGFLFLLGAPRGFEQPYAALNTNLMQGVYIIYIYIIIRLYIVVVLNEHDTKTCQTSLHEAMFAQHAYAASPQVPQNQYLLRRVT